MKLNAKKLMSTLLVVCMLLTLWVQTGCGNLPSVTTATPETTKAPATEAPATEAPTTEAPATEAPATEAPATEAPTTEAPSTTEGAGKETTEAPEEEYPDEDFGMPVPPNGEREIINTEVKLNISGGASEMIEVAYYADAPDLLLVEINYAVHNFMNDIFRAMNPEYSITIDDSDVDVMLERSNGALCLIDFVYDTIYFNDFDLFTMLPNAISIHDLLSDANIDANGSPIYVTREDYFETAGLPISISLAEREIPLDIYEGEKYIPLQTFADLFLTNASIGFIYNGVELFMIVGGAVDPAFMADLFPAEVKPRSEELVKYNYNELCLLLDLYYGLGEEHGFKNGFSAFLSYSNLYEAMTSDDPKEFFGALCELTLGHIGDLHSSVSLPSPYCGDPAIINTAFQHASNKVIAYVNNCQRYSTIRAGVFAELGYGQAYEEVGNTAYITFDSFIARTADYYGEFPEAIPEDTMGLVIYAHKQITRENSPIENVVIDLSCNGGGALDSAVYLLSWLLGSCTIDIESPITGSKSSTTYVADVNLDGKFDENDNISSLNIFCLTSPASFSCGNLVPAVLKASGRVTILGDKSGGGACAVLNATTADGTVFCISSSKHLSIAINGSFHSIDAGIEPHYKITKVENFYNREALTEYINSLY